jgi:cytochrome c oxidase subunit 4
MFRIIPIQQAGKSLIRFTLVNQSAIAAKPLSSAAVGHHDSHQHVFNKKEVYARIGEREIVGFGRNGEPTYYDAADSPCPAIRWKEDTPQIKALRQNTNWSKLTIEEKRICKLLI